MGAVIAIVLGYLLFLGGIQITSKTSIPDLAMLGLIMCIVGIALAVAGVITGIAEVLF